MPRNKTEKTTISFEKSELIKKIVGDIATKENKSLSAIIERIILESLMPKNDNARWIVEHHLYAEDGEISKALSAIFSFNSAGIHWGAKYDNLLPLVIFAKTQEELSKTSLTGKEEILYHTRSQIDSVVYFLQNRSEKEEAAGDMIKALYYKQEASWCSNLLNELKVMPQESKLVHIYQVIINNWEDFKNWTITYRLLSDLAVLGKGWPQDSGARMELLKILKNVTDEWEC